MSAGPIPGKIDQPKLVDLQIMGYLVFGFGKVTPCHPKLHEKKQDSIDSFKPAYFNCFLFSTSTITIFIGRQFRNNGQI
jgi:hypothetical protein